MAKPMRAAVVREFGKPLTIEEVPVPEPCAGEIQVKVHAGRRFQVLKVMRLVDEQVIDAKLVEHQAVSVTATHAVKCPSTFQIFRGAN